VKSQPNSAEFISGLVSDSQLWVDGDIELSGNFMVLKIRDRLFLMGYSEGISM
jgi:hypothetical protein